MVLISILQTLAELDAVASNYLAVLGTVRKHSTVVVVDAVPK